VAASALLDDDAASGGHATNLADVSSSAGRGGSRLTFWHASVSSIGWPCTCDVTWPIHAINLPAACQTALTLIVTGIESDCS